MLFSRLTALLKKPLTVNHAKQIHAQILWNHVHELEPLLIHPLFSLACSSTPNSFYYVQRILLLLQEPDSFCWSRCIYYCSHHGRFKGALSLYAQMQRLGLPPSTFSVSSALKACARLGYKIGGVSIHGQVHKYEILCGVHVQTSLLDFYSKTRNMESAQKVFDEMSERSVVSWNSKLSGYLKYGDLASAKHLFCDANKGFTFRTNARKELGFVEFDDERVYRLWQVGLSSALLRHDVSEKTASLGLS